MSQVGRRWGSGSPVVSATTRHCGLDAWHPGCSLDDVMRPRPRALPTFPGVSATADGSEAVVWVETHVSQGACAYPITSSTNMGAGYQAAQAAGKKNL